MAKRSGEYVSLGKKFDRSGTPSFQGVFSERELAFLDADATWAVVQSFLFRHIGEELVLQPDSVAISNGVEFLPPEHASQSRCDCEAVNCERCGGQWMSPSGLDATRRESIAYLVRTQHIIEAIKAIRDATDVGLADAKAIYHHITRERGKCQRCGAALNGQQLTSCGGCGSLNYDW